MKKLFLSVTVLIVTMLATTMVAFAGAETLKKDDNGIYWYYNNDVKDTSKSGMVNYDGGLFIVIDGVLRTDFMGMCHVEFPDVNKWYFFSAGQVQKAWTGFAEYNKAWFYLDKGELDSTKTGIYEYDGGKFLLAEGRLIKEYSGLYQHTQGPGADSKWYFFANGQLQETYSGLAEYDGEWFYLENGCLNENYTGYVEYNGGRFYVENGMVKPIAIKYTVQDISGLWSGTIGLSSVSGTSEMIKYLEGLYGRSLTETEIEGLNNPVSSDGVATVDIYDYIDSYNVAYPGSWELELNMGNFFGNQLWTDWDILTYKEFYNKDRDGGCIVLDDTNAFYLSVVEEDLLGEYGAQVFDVADSQVEGDGSYGITFLGKVYPGIDGTPQVMEGQLIITFQYGNMSEPYIMHYTYSFDTFDAR